MLMLQTGDNSPRRVPLTHIRGRAAGDLMGSSAPKFCGTLSTDGLIRIDCENYLAHWQEIQLPEEVVQAWKEYRSKKAKEEVKPNGETVRKTWESAEKEVNKDVLTGLLNMVNERPTALDKSYDELKLKQQQHSRLLSL